MGGQGERRAISDVDALDESIAGIASYVMELQLRAAEEYKPLVVAISLSCNPVHGTLTRAR